MISRQARTVVLFCIFAIFIDQISKYLAASVVINTGISFGMFSSSFLTMGLILVLGGIIYGFGKQFMSVSPVATGIFFGGSASNLFDRIAYGGVRDFLPVPTLAVRNNLADWCIVLGLLWLFFHMPKSSSTR